MSTTKFIKCPHLQLIHEFFPRRLLPSIYKYSSQWEHLCIHCNKANGLLYISMLFDFSAAFETVVVPFETFQALILFWHYTLLVLCLLIWLSLKRDIAWGEQMSQWYYWYCINYSPLLFQAKQCLEWGWKSQEELSIHTVLSSVCTGSPERTVISIF